MNALSQMGVTPNMLTVFGVAGNIVAAVLAGYGEFLAAGIVVLFFSAPRLPRRGAGAGDRTGDAVRVCVRRDDGPRVGGCWCCSGCSCSTATSGGPHGGAPDLRRGRRLADRELRAGAGRDHRREDDGGAVHAGRARGVAWRRAHNRRCTNEPDVITGVLWILAVLTPLTALQRLYIIWRDSKGMEEPTQ